jgi:GNAT superfamily N-acetyltransferase/predicted nucleic acid-binding protein
MIDVRCIDEHSPLLKEVRRLWRENAQWLGFYPEGAFAERARMGQLLVALDNQTCAGYLAYYTGQQNRKARLTHLCVAGSARGKGVARRLIDTLRERTKHLLGIGLHCRQDFPASRAWPRLGFVAISERIGRGRDQHVLTFYWLEHSHPDLFSSAPDPDDERLDVAIDANIFYDLLDPTRPCAEETDGIVAEWLQPLIRLCVTEELLNEISRNPDAAERSAQRAEFSNFDRLECATEDFFAAEKKVRALLGEPKSEQDAADRRQLARTIASAATVFVTRDTDLLGAADRIYDACGLSIVRPSELVARFEELRHEGEYQKAQLAGTRMQIGRISGGDASLIDAFGTSDTERRRQFERQLRVYLSHPDTFSCSLITGETGDVQAIYVVEDRGPHLTTVPLFRLAQRTIGTRRAGTLARTLLAGILSRRGHDKYGVILFEEPLLPSAVTNALTSAGFVPSQAGWAKFAIRTIGTCDWVATLLNDCMAATGARIHGLVEIAALLENGTAQADPLLASQLEHILWPSKLLECGIPNFIVPIRPRWSRDLFDAGLANETLFGADEELALNPDSIYYRAVRPRGLAAPGRILWYTSGDGKVDGTKRIRACSRLDQVETGTPKELYRQFRRLGVYQWRDVFDAAGKSLDAELMAVRFSDTELLERPMGLPQLRELLRAHGAWNNFQSPLQIPEAAFVAIYEQGTGTVKASG